MTAYSAAMQVVHNEADADDIAQETMVKLYLNIDALDEDRVEGWVRVAAKNLGIDYQRKTQRFDWNELDAVSYYTSPSPRDKRQSRMPSSA